MTELNAPIETMKKRRQEAAFDPYYNIWMAGYYQSIGENEKMILHSEAIAEAENFSPFWYTVISHLRLARH